MGLDMETKKKIGIAFLLNLLFSVLEAVGGIVTGSVAILSDAVHDFGDALSIGLSYLFEKVAGKKPDTTYTYGYARFSVLGGLINNVILLVGSVLILFGAVSRIIAPAVVDSQSMMILALVGLLVNGVAVYFTHGGKSINQRAVNLHMLEDLLGWVIVLLGAIVMRFTGWVFIDPMLSIFVAVYIATHALGGLKETLNIFLMKKPSGLSTDEVAERLQSLDGVVNVHHLHLWTMDGEQHCATLHAVVKGDSSKVKERIKSELLSCGVSHVTVELELLLEACNQRDCGLSGCGVNSHCHHCH